MTVQLKTINARIKNLTLNRNKQTILTDISIHLHSGNFILMTGQNGSGKSTLLKVISGLTKPDSFTLCKNSHNAGQKKYSWSAARKYLRQNFCYLHQTPYLFNSTVYENIAYGLKRRGLSKDKIDHLVNEILHKISLQHLTKRPSNTLSGGEKQRVAIARSWVIRPAFILLDEPFANMDKRSRSTSYDIINQLKEDNIGIILTSHDAHSGELNFNKHLHLYQGTLREKTPSLCKE